MSHSQSDPSPPTYEIGGWTFDPASNRLKRADETRALEFRAARLLEELCKRRGEVVAREVLIRAVWQGRELSAHTIAVVISNLRKALDDDAKSPRLIETVAKRGYRLIEAEKAAAPVSAMTGNAQETVSRRALGVAGLALAGAALIGAGFFAIRESQSSAPVTIITINTIVDASGDNQFAAMAAAAGEFSADYLSKAGDSVLISDFNDGKSWKTNKTLERWFGRDTIVYHLSGKVVVDAGAPFIALSVADGRDWTIVWTAALRVDDSGVAPGLRGALTEFLIQIGRLKPGADISA
jgi:DNA-binding winged helix-turn-helix (wHTH) protein